MAGADWYAPCVVCRLAIGWLDMGKQMNGTTAIVLRWATRWAVWVVDEGTSVVVVKE